MLKAAHVDKTICSLGYLGISIGSSGLNLKPSSLTCTQRNLRCMPVDACNIERSHRIGIFIGLERRSIVDKFSFSKHGGER